MFYACTICTLSPNINFREKVLKVQSEIESETKSGIEAETESGTQYKIVWYTFSIKCICILTKNVTISPQIWLCGGTRFELQNSLETSSKNFIFKQS